MAAICLLLAVPRQLSDGRQQRIEQIRWPIPDRQVRELPVPVEVRVLCYVCLFPISLKSLEFRVGMVFWTIEVEKKDHEFIDQKHWDEQEAEGPDWTSEKGKEALATCTCVERQMLTEGLLAGLYTDESPGLKVDPVVVLVLSLGFIFSVVALHSSYPPSASSVTLVSSGGCFQ